MLILPSGRVIDRIRPRRKPARRHSIDKQIGQGVEKGLVIGSNQLLAIGCHHPRAVPPAGSATITSIGRG